MWNTHGYRFWSSTKKISWWEYVAWVRNLKSTMPSRGVERSRSTLTPAFLPQLYRKIHERKRFHRTPSRVSSIAKGSSWIWFWRRETHVSFRLALCLITIPSCDVKSSGLSVIERIRSVEIQREVLTSFVPMGDFAGSHMNRRLVRGFRDDLK